MAALFRAHRGEWISAIEIARVGGLLSSRTRISECRTRLGMDIENETRNVGRTKYSYYRLKA